MDEEKKMTVQEVADLLGYKADTIQKVSRRLESEGMIGRIEIRPDFSKALLLNKEQVEEIKRNLAPRTLALKSTVDSVTTDAEMIQKAKDFMQWATVKIQEETEKRIAAERKNAVLMHVTKTYTASEIAKEIGMRSAIELNQAMSDCKMQYKQNGTWLPCAQYADRGFFVIKQQELDNGKVIYDRKITQLGREFLLEHFGDSK